MQYSIWPKPTHNSHSYTGFVDVKMPHQRGWGKLLLNLISAKPKKEMFMGATYKFKVGHPVTAC